MKKKFVVISFVMIISLGLLFIAKSIQNNNYLGNKSGNLVYYDVSQNNNAINEKEVSNSKAISIDGTSSNSSSTNTNNIDATSLKDAQKENLQNTNNNVESKANNQNINDNTEPKNNNLDVNTQSNNESINVSNNNDWNFRIIDTVNNKVIISRHYDIEGKNAGDITIMALKENNIKYKATNIAGIIYFSMIDSLFEKSAGPLSGWCFYVNNIKPDKNAASVVLGRNDKLEWKFLKDGVN